MAIKDLTEVLTPGNTEIWYVKPDNSRDFRYADEIADWNSNTLKDTHVLLGTTNETNVEKIWMMMQGENWSPRGEANQFIQSKGLWHTSMDLGDIIKTKDGFFMVTASGFKKLGSQLSVSSDLRQIATSMRISMNRKQQDFLAFHCMVFSYDLIEYWDEMVQGYYQVLVNESIDQETAEKQIAYWMRKLPGTVWHTGIPEVTTPPKMTRHQRDVLRDAVIDRIQTTLTGEWESNPNSFTDLGLDYKTASEQINRWISRF